MGTCGLILSIVLLGCDTQKSAEPIRTWTENQVPASLGDSLPEPNRNQLSDAGFELGRRLFYDAGFSRSGKVSCGSCHQQEKAFATGQALELGTDGQQLHRHSPTLFNLAWMPGLMWDGGVKNLESLAFAPLLSEVEMGNRLEEHILELNQDPQIVALCQASFQSDSLNSALMARAMAQFMRAMLSFSSPFDAFLLHGDSSQLPSTALQGYRVYQAKCQSCHPPPLFTDNAYHNIGLDTSYNTRTDFGLFTGRFRISLDSGDFGAFKTPSLRNVAVSAPYMHDGRFSTLEEVLNHYDTGVLPDRWLDPAYKTKASANGLALTKQEKGVLVAFMHSLSDTLLLESPRFSDPFLH